MQINSSLDWQHVHSKLRTQVNSLPFNPDLRKMLNNISNMVSELSKLEVEARRTQKFSYLEKQIEAINKSIDHLEKLLLMAELLK
jgi:hypothetical protein